jgi:hypothetical protein
LPFPERASAAISSMLAPSKPRSRNTFAGRVEDALLDFSG